MSLKTSILSDDMIQDHSLVLTLHWCDLTEVWKQDSGEMVIKTQSWIQRDAKSNCLCHYRRSKIRILACEPVEFAMVGKRKRSILSHYTDLQNFCV